MNKEIYAKFNNVIKAECDYVIKNELDLKQKCDKMNALFNLKKLIDNYDELEPILVDYFNKKAREEKCER